MLNDGNTRREICAEMGLKGSVCKAFVFLELSYGTGQCGHVCSFACVFHVCACCRCNSPILSAHCHPALSGFFLRGGFCRFRDGVEVVSLRADGTIRRYERVEKHRHRRPREKARYIGRCSALFHAGGLVRKGVHEQTTYGLAIHCIEHLRAALKVIEGKQTTDVRR